MALPASYPTTRAERGVPSSFSPPPPSAAVTAIPRTSVVAFKIANLALNSRESRSFGPFVGPAILKGIRLEINNNVANAAAAFGLGVASSAITEDSVALTTPKGWRELIDNILRDTAALATGARGFMQTDSPATALNQGHELNHIITDRNFFVVLTAYCGGAGFRWNGDFTIVDGVSETALANFL